MNDGFKAKICGTTNLADAVLAAEEGADFFGAVVEVGFSPRSLSIDEARPLFEARPIPGVALVHDMEQGRVEEVIKRLTPFAVQFLGCSDIGFLKKLKKERPSVELWQSVHLPGAGGHVAVDDFKREVQAYIDAGVDALLFDTAAMVGGKMKFGGTGVTSDWKVVKELMTAVRGPVPIWLAGGINPVNVGEALDFVEPYGIDLCSGVEARPGKKDPMKVKALMSTIKSRSTMRRQVKK